jgi:hemerythrin-like domain-containing protein
MLHEHDLGRELLAMMTEAIDGGAVAKFVPIARSYINLMSRHIWKEDQRLFQMAERLLGAEDDASLLRGFEATEHKDLGTGTHENYLELADRLAHRFGVAVADAPAKCGCGCTPHALTAEVGGTN